MDMEQGYGEGENPVVLKSEFLLSLCEQSVGAGKLSAKETQPDQIDWERFERTVSHVIIGTDNAITVHF